ncbi:hypothetical protein HYD54_02930 [Mycoplasmopsis bovis]|nr:hypothetical protein [Mycoplasmopsis bovis]QQH71881.1 hypothetical protein HYD54_02930 [Mycoplasmopsis bovis]
MNQSQIIFNALKKWLLEEKRWFWLSSFINKYNNSISSKVVQGLKKFAKKFGLDKTVV